MNLNLLSWVILLALSATLATAAQYLFFRHDWKKTDYDWVYIAGGALLGGFTATVWYHIGPVVAGLSILPTLAEDTRHSSDFHNNDPLSICLCPPFSK